MSGTDRGTLADVGDGLPSLPTGEPVLARWFVAAMLVLVPAGIGVTVWAFASVGGTTIGVAERRPPGTAQVTHPRGEAALNDTTTTEPGPGCASGVTLVGDDGARAAARRALGATCQLLRNRDLPAVERGLDRWAAGDGRLRFAVFERTGLDSSARVTGPRPVIELNARYQFEDATQAAPFVIHELVHLGRDRWPGAPVDVAGELAAMEAQDTACGLLAFTAQPPRGCRDAAQLVAAPDAAEQLAGAGYPRRDAEGGS